MKTVMEKMDDHLKESIEHFSLDNIVGVFLQGSQNYGLETPNSDVDTKLIITPSFREIALNKPAVSTTHIRENQEHIDFKDIRLYMETFRKQNLNFLEILFTQHSLVNASYVDQWTRLVQKREQIARMNPYRAVRSMYGIAGEKFHAMKHPYPSKIHLIEKYGYDGKQVSHLIRVDDYLERYIAGESYETCLKPSPEKFDEIMAYKLQQIPLEIAEVRAKEVYEHAEQLKNQFCEGKTEQEDEEMRALLEDVQYEIMKKSVAIDLERG